MYIEAATLDDLMNKVFSELLDQPFNITASRGTMSELTGVLLCLKNPRARLSRTETKGTLFSAMGELFWYLSKGDDLKFITHYIERYKDESENSKTVYGAYGPRFFNSQGKYNQIRNIIKLLRKRQSSRRAVIQIFEAKDISKKHIEIPCTCTLQFLIREEKLNLMTTMRSNDAYFGLPHDIFTFTMLQEIMARTLNLEVGIYKHFAGSLHLYEEKKESAKIYLNEGFQSTRKPMGAMPMGDPWPAIKKILKAEVKIRNEKKIRIERSKLDPYWTDVIRILQIHQLFKEKDFNEINSVKNHLSDQIYNTYIEKRVTNTQK